MVSPVETRGLILGLFFGHVVELSDGLNRGMTSLGRMGLVGRAFDLLFIELTSGMKQKGNFTLWQAAGWRWIWHKGRVPGRKEE